MRVFLAPHHDDLLLSLPVWLCAGQPRETLHVAIVFSDESDALAAICNRLHSDLNICAYPLGLAEAGRRGLAGRALLRRWRGAGEVDDAQLRQTHEVLTPLLARLAPAELVAPASLVHIDHALTRLTAELALAEGAVQRITYYADQPYARLWPDAIDLAEPLPEARRIAAPREAIHRLLSALVPFISEMDVQRLLAAYGPGPNCQSESLWRRCSLPGAAGGTIVLNQAVRGEPVEP